ncbi:hypothetical protein BG005_006770 [Podila minutissima]|nr:hypothetical protein BG005_006770 [Podila minutissima]
MVRLKIIRLSRDDELPQEDLAAFLDFLRIHHSAFPYKRRLEIYFDLDWTKIYHDHTPESRQWAKTFNQGIVTIYKGLGRIYALDSTSLIDFYALWEDTDLGHLEELEENDFYRWQTARNLQHIRLHYGGTAPDAVKILNDATTAFAPSLRTIAVECGRYGWGSIPPTYYVGQALDHWNLPWMTHLKIYIPRLYGLRIGSLDKCSMLKSLVLRFGAGNPPQKLEDDNRTLELFPKWTLPRLTELDLQYTPALLFNYDSLETMSSLRQIDIYAHDSEFMQHVHKIPRLSAHVTPLRDPESVGCPRLKRLHLYGSDHPQRLPLSWSAPCALTLLPMTEPAEIPWVDAYSPTQPQLYQPLGPFSGNVEDPPLLDHQLAGLTMCGRWVMSEQDFVRVLTHYAPNLQDLNVNLIHEFNDANRKGYQVGHLILEADRIRRELGRGGGGGEGGGEGGGGVPKEEEKVEKQEDHLPDQVDYSPRKTRLTTVRTGYWIDDSQINDLGMAVIGGKNLVKKYTSAGLRVYSFCSRYFADTVNHTFIEQGSDEEDATP